MTLDRVKKVLAEHLEIDENEISESTTLEDMGVDSLDAVEIIMELEVEFGIEIHAEDAGKSVKEFVDYIDSKLA